MERNKEKNVYKIFPTFRDKPRLSKPWKFCTKSWKHLGSCLRPEIRGLNIDSRFMLNPINVTYGVCRSKPPKPTPVFENKNRESRKKLIPIELFKKIII